MATNLCVVRTGDSVRVVATVFEAQDLVSEFEEHGGSGDYRQLKLSGGKLELISEINEMLQEQERLKTEEWRCR